MKTFTRKKVIIILVKNLGYTQMNLHLLHCRKTQGGIFLYVLILWGVITFFLTLALILFGSSISHTKNISTALQNDYKRENIISNVVERYKQDQGDISIALKQSGFSHQISQFQKSHTVELNADIADESFYAWEFHDGQEEISFIDINTGAFYDNQLYKIKNFKLSWNVGTNTTEADVKTYNALQRNEQSNLRVYLLKRSGSVVQKCFLSSNVVSGANGAFQNSFTFSEASFMSTSYGDIACTEDDPDEVNTVLNNNGADALDLLNTHYVLLVEALNGITHVKLETVGNNGSIPTGYATTEVIPEAGGVSVNQTDFVGGNKSIVFDLLDDSERGGITNTGDLTAEKHQTFLKMIVDKYK
jgi:hypothetical protein